MGRNLDLWRVVSREECGYLGGESKNSEIIEQCDKLKERNTSLKMEGSRDMKEKESARPAFPNWEVQLLKDHVMAPVFRSAGVDEPLGCKNIMLFFIIR